MKPIVPGTDPTRPVTTDGRKYVDTGEPTEWELHLRKEEPQMTNRENKTRAEDADTLRKLVEKYRQDALDAGTRVEDITIGDALNYLAE